MEIVVGGVARDRDLGHQEGADDHMFSSSLESRRMPAHDAQRQRVCAMFSEVFSALLPIVSRRSNLNTGDPNEMHTMAPNDLAKEVEAALFEQLRRDATEPRRYLAQARSLVFNLRRGDPQAAGSLAQRVICGEIQPEELPLLSPDDMAPLHLREERRRQRREAVDACTAKIGQPANVFVTCGQVRGFSSGRL